MAENKIKVMVVDDSVAFRHFISRSYADNLEIEVVGTAVDAITAKHKLKKLRPDVIVLDMELPVVRGGDFLKDILPLYPDIKVVVVSYISSNVFEALQAGAVDFISKPDTRPNFDQVAFLHELTKKIKIAAASRSKLKLEESVPPQPPRPQAPPPYNGPAAERYAPRPAPPPAAYIPHNVQSVIAIGASTGGTEALAFILEKLPANTPAILIVQHMPPVFTKMFAERLDQLCKMSVREARNGDRVRQGEILIAPGDSHMRLFEDAGGYCVQCAPGERVSGHCPSVDVLFESVARYAGANAVGVILTGMGSDGAKQMLTMRSAGAYTIGQDKESCVVYGMPMAAMRLGAVAEQYSLSEIPAAIIRHFMGR